MEISKIDDAIAKAKEQLKNLSADKMTIEEYEDRQKYLRDEIDRLSYAKNTGYNEGMKKGIEINKKEIIINLFKNGITDIDKLKKYTGASEKLINETIKSI